MSIKYTLFDPNLGNIPLEVAIAGTPFNPDTLTDVDISGGTITDTTINASLLETVHIAGLTATGLATFESVQVTGLTATQIHATGNSVLVTTQVSAFTATGLSTLSTVQMGGLTATQQATLATAQIGMLSATQIAGQTTFTANGAALVSVQLTGFTANSLAIITLKTVGGTVGALPTIKSVNLADGHAVIAATASDTSTYNIGWLA